MLEDLQEQYFEISKALDICRAILSSPRYFIMYLEIKPIDLSGQLYLCLRCTDLAEGRGKDLFFKLEAQTTDSYLLEIANLFTKEIELEIACSNPNCYYYKERRTHKYCVRAYDLPISLGKLDGQVNQPKQLIRALIKSYNADDMIRFWKNPEQFDYLICPTCDHRIPGTY